MAQENRQGFWKDFRDFALRGNVIDLAIAVVLGAAFGRVIDSFVKDVLMPPLGLLLGHADFSNLFVVLKSGTPHGPYATLATAQAAGAVTVSYGLLLNNLVSFAIIAFSVFLIVRGLLRSARRRPAAPAAPPEDVVLLRDIRDELRSQRGPLQRARGADQPGADEPKH